MKFENWMIRHSWERIDDELYTNGKFYAVKRGDKWVAAKDPDGGERWPGEWPDAEGAIRYAEGKMRPRVSYEVEHRYKSKTYTQLNASLRKDFAAQVKEYAAAHNMSITALIKTALTEYMEDK